MSAWADAAKIFPKFQPFLWFSDCKALATVIICGGHKEVTLSNKIPTTSQTT